MSGGLVERRQRKLADLSPWGHCGNERWNWHKAEIIGTGTPISISIRNVSELGDRSDCDKAAGAFIDNVQLCLVRRPPKSSCGGDSVLYARTPYPHLSWVIKQNDHFSRLWWDHGNFEEQVDYTGRPA